MSRLAPPAALLLAASLCFTLTSCRNSGSKKAAADTDSTKTAAAPAAATVAFPYIQIPQDKQNSPSYAATRFWDDYLDPARTFDPDTTLVAGVAPQYLTHAFEQYASVLGHCSTPEALAAQDTLMKRLSTFEERHDNGAVRSNLLFLNEHYFFDPQSPYRCEDFYIPVLEAELKLSGKNAPDQADASRYSFALEGCRMNRIGTKAKNLTLTSPEGAKTELRSIKSDYYILVFGNPDCEACRELTACFNNPDSTAAAWNYPQMADFIRELPNLAARKKVAFIGIYPDEDIASWKRHAGDYPDYWHSYRSRIPDRTAGYSLRAIPSLYLLDRNQTVMMKDPTIDRILDFLLSRL